MLFLLIVLIGFGVEVEESNLIESFNGEWTAPGYSTVLEAEIDPRDYDGLSMGSPEEPIKLAMQGFFVDTDEGEKWRVVMVFSDKIFVIQEDAETREIPLTLSCYGAYFSRGGRYVIVRLKDTNSNDNEARLINLDDGMVKFFDYYTTNGGSTFTWIGENGTVLTYLYSNRRASDTGLLSFYNQNLLVAQIEGDFVPGMSQDGNLICCGVYPNPESREDFYCVGFNSVGEKLWETPSDIRFNMRKIFISNNGEHVAVSSSGVALFDGVSGELLWESLYNISSVVYSESNEYYSLMFRNTPERTTDLSAHGISIVRSDEYSGELDDLKILDLIGISVGISNSGSSLWWYFVENNSETEIYYFLLNKDGEITWISPKFSTVPLVYNNGPYNNNIEQNYEGDMFAQISSNQNRVLYSVYSTVKVINIRERAQ